MLSSCLKTPFAPGWCGRMVIWLLEICRGVRGTYNRKVRKYLWHQGGRRLKTATR